MKLAPALGQYAKAEAWAEERDRVRAAILERGWSEQRQAYAQSFDSDELDAAQLLMPILGFLPADDPRMRSTIEAIARDLTEDGLVLRYRNAAEGINLDGLAGEEGTFVICSFWLVSCLAQGGRAGAGAGSCSTSSPATPTTSACWQRRSTPLAASCWETSRRRSATSA